MTYEPISNHYIWTRIKTVAWWNDCLFLPLIIFQIIWGNLTLILHEWQYHYYLQEITHGCCMELLGWKDKTDKILWPGLYEQMCTITFMHFEYIVSSGVS